jgi:Na+-driven multidrug efflux pump
MLFQSIGKSMPALILSCLQSGLLFIPLCVILPQFLDVLGIELAQPLAYFLSALISLPMTFGFLKKLPKDE